jgi:mannose-6-phosphate isomerase
MKGIFRLKNEIKQYDWGAIDRLPAFLGVANAEKAPYAELWMGAHRGGASLALCENEIPLDVLLKTCPAFYLGDALAERYGELPYLFKILSIAKPLSLQVHPNSAQAKEGFERENRAGISLNGENRNYKDANEKTELICALSPMKALCGFRPLDTIKNLFRMFDFSETNACVDGLADGDAAWLYLLRSLLDFSQEQKQALRRHIAENISLLPEKYPAYKDEWELTAKLSGLYEDSAVLAPLFLNLLSLEEGDALFIPAGTIHSYLEGDGVEIMSASDNVLRGGLTKKYIDKDEILAVCNNAPYLPSVMKADDTQNYFSFPAETDAFTLGRLKNTEGSHRLPPEGPVIILVTRGTLTITFDGGQGALAVKRGETVFVAAGENRSRFNLSGNYSAYCGGARI